MNKKYFVIGFNKTATTTFHNLFLQNNLKSQHMKSRYWDTSTYDCFSDITSGDNIWKNLDKIYTDAVFILNIRNLDKWLISRFKHGLRGMLKPIGHILIHMINVNLGYIKGNLYTMRYYTIF